MKPLILCNLILQYTLPMWIIEDRVFIIQYTFDNDDVVSTLPMVEHMVDQYHYNGNVVYAVTRRA
jgi:hypothetical protein